MIEEEWKKIVGERSQTMIDGVVGVVIALGAYMLMSVSVTDWSQLNVILWFFLAIFMITGFLWYIAGQSIALAPHDGKLFGLNLLLVALLAPIPFSARLVLFSEIKELAVTLLLINTGVVFALTFMIDILVLHKPESRHAPRSVLGDLQAQQFGLPAGSVFAFLFLLVPREQTLGGPFAGWNIPLRALGFLLSFYIFFLITMVAEVFVRRRIPLSADETPQVQKISRILHLKMRAVNNTLFGMALGLCVFSLTDLPVKAASDLLPPFIHFAFLFLLIYVFWNKLYRVYATIPIWEEGIDFFTNIIALLAVMTPPAFRFAVLPEPETRVIGIILFPILIVALAAVNAVLYLYASRLKRGVTTVSSDTIREFRRWAAGSLFLAFMFLASMLIPMEAIFFMDISLRIVVWWISLVIFIVSMQVASPSSSHKLS